nr:hypothetical protein [Tanacetum cinerariifolium]
MVEPEQVKVEQYIRGLSKTIRGDVTSSRPAGIDEAVCMTYQLMGQIIQDKTDEVSESEKRKGEGDHGGRDDNRRDYNRRQNQRRVNAGAMTNDAPNDNEVCPKCKNKKHGGDCWKCGKLGHKTSTCWSLDIKDGIIADLDAYKDVTLEEVEVEKNAEALSMQDDVEEPTELQEVIEVVTTAKLMTEVVTAATTTISIAASITVATIIVASTAARRRKGYFNSNVSFLEKSKEQLEEEENRSLKRQSESLEEKAAKKQKLDEEVEELKKHLQIVPNDDDDVYTEATPLALKIHIVQDRFASSKPKNFSDDFLLTTLKYMFEKPDVEA